jgi:hypothetical protein
MLFATLDTVRDQPAAAQFQFRARNQGISGTHSRSTIQGFFGAGMEDATRTTPFVYDAADPEVLVGGNTAPTAGGVPAARHRGLPDVGDRHHRGRPRHPAASGGVNRRG